MKFRASRIVLSVLQTIFVFLLFACSAPNDSVEALTDPTPERTCQPLSEADIAAIKAVISESTEVIFSHDVAAYCRLYTQNSTEIGGRGAIPDSYDVAIPFTSRLQFHGLREGTQVKQVPEWTTKFAQIDGNSCSAVVEGSVTFTFDPQYSMVDGMRVELVRTDAHWQIARARDWIVSESGKPRDLTPLDQAVEEARQLSTEELAWTLYEAARYEEAFQVLKRALQEGPPNASLAILYSTLAVNADHLEELIPAYRLMAELTPADELPPYIATVLARVDAGEELTITCP